MSIARQKYIVEIYQGKDKLWYWRLKERKGRKRILADGGEGYSKKYNAKRALVTTGLILYWMGYDVEGD